MRKIKKKRNLKQRIKYFFIFLMVFNSETGKLEFDDNLRINFFSSPLKHVGTKRGDSNKYFKHVFMEKCRYA